MVQSIQKLFEKFSYKKILIISAAALGMGVVFAGVLLPRIIRMVMKMQLQLTPGTMSRDMFTALPFPLDFKVYIWNVTNPDEVMSGEKPKLQEIGPYYFEEWKSKADLVDNDEDDTLEYDFINTFIYAPEKNGPGLTGEEHVVVAHPLVLGMALAINMDREELLPFIQAAINGLLHTPKDIFFSGRVMDLLFDGIILDCSSEDFEVSAACSEFSSGQYKEIQPLNDTAYVFSLFGGANGTSTGRYKVLRGKKDIHDMGKVLTFNDEEEVENWDEECNKIHGTDSTIFPPFMDKEQGLWTFQPGMCRSIPGIYQHPIKFRGMKGNHFTIGFGDIANTPELKCFCRDEENCPLKGTMDLFPCVGDSKTHLTGNLPFLFRGGVLSTVAIAVCLGLGTPIVLSLPHFYDADPSILEKIGSGMDPDQTKHEMFINFHQLSGSPFQAAGRFQINIDVVPIEDIEILKNVQPMFLPVLWAEEGVVLPKKFSNMLKYQLVLGFKIQKLMKYGCTLGGIIGLIVGGVAFYFQPGEEDETKPVKSASDTAGTPKAQAIEVITNGHE